jgi:hypothetical protein
VPPAGSIGDGKPGSWGGHAIPVVAYDTRGSRSGRGELAIDDLVFLGSLLRRAYVILSDDYMNGKKQAPQGLGLKQL